MLYPAVFFRIFDFLQICVIIQARKLACKDFRAQYFNRNGGLAKTKRPATAVADKILFCLVSML